MVRGLFKESNLTIVTNGILLKKQSDEFYKCCKENNVHIEITKYPINFNYDEVIEFLKINNISHSFVGSTAIKDKTTHKLALDEYGNQDPTYSYNNCFHSTKCYQYYDGKLFMCPCCAYINKLNKKFNKNFIVTDKDYLEISKIKTLDEILDYLSNPIPFCKYCDVDKRTFKSVWSTSSKKEEEWL